MGHKTKEERAAYNKRWYAIPENKEAKKRRAAISKPLILQRNKDFAAAYKKSKGCSTCGENDDRCLDFHHVNPAEKEDAVSRLVCMGVGLPRILVEIEKCIILCANCHRKLHRQTCS